MIKTFLIVAVCLLASVVAFFMGANRATGRAHARFQTKDVESALSELFAPDSPTLDNFDLFLAWPIDDPYLESVRQRCLTLVQEPPQHRPGRLSATRHSKG